MRRRLAFTTLTALARLLAADDVIIVNLGIENVIRLSTQGFMPDPAEDDDSLPGPAGASSRSPRTLPVGSLQDEGSSSLLILMATSWLRRSAR